MTLQQINYLLTISESQSMNKAAEKLFIAQPTLTGAVRDAENVKASAQSTGVRALISLSTVLHRR